MLKSLLLHSYSYSVSELQQLYNILETYTCNTGKLLADKITSKLPLKWPTLNQFHAETLLYSLLCRALQFCLAMSIKNTFLNILLSCIASSSMQYNLLSLEQN